MPVPRFREHSLVSRAAQRSAGSGLLGRAVRAAPLVALCGLAPSSEPGGSSQRCPGLRERSAAREVGVCPVTHSDCGKSRVLNTY